MTANHIPTMRELDSRTNDGLHVRLLWDPDDGRIAVVVDDAKTGEELAFDVPDRERALHAFRHPFAYAAWHGVEAGTSVGAGRTLAMALGLVAGSRSPGAPREMREHTV